MVSDAASSIVSDGNMHMVALVANQTSLSFYTDANLQSEMALDRPITDCTGRALVVGAPGGNLSMWYIVSSVYNM
jgi:hypothetical protein